jgi:hypothetical protein
MYVEIDLDGKSRKLRYDFNALADIEERAGLGIGAIFSEQRVGFHSIRLLVWGGLKWQDRGLTLERAGKMVGDYLQNGGTFEGLMDKVRQALQKSGMADFKEVEEEGDEGNAEAETAN